MGSHCKSTESTSSSWWTQMAQSVSRSTQPLRGTWVRSPVWPRTPRVTPSLLPRSPSSVSSSLETSLGQNHGYRRLIRLSISSFKTNLNYFRQRLTESSPLKSNLSLFHAPQSLSNAFWRLTGLSVTLEAIQARDLEKTLLPSTCSQLSSPKIITFVLYVRRSTPLSKGSVITFLLPLVGLSYLWPKISQADSG